MKGFIEVHNIGNETFLINVEQIKRVWGNYIINKDKSTYECQESYEQIKELIKQAQ